MKTNKHLKKKEIFINRLKHIKTDINDNFEIIGCESDELYENDEFFNFWSKKTIIKELKQRFQDNRDGLL